MQNILSNHICGEQIVNKATNQPRVKRKQKHWPCATRNFENYIYISLIYLYFSGFIS